eukprot:gene15081-6248_t
MECEILSANVWERKTDLLRDETGWDHYGLLQTLERCEAYDKEQLCDAEQVCEEDYKSPAGYKCKNLENIALGRDASQSSTWLEGIASKAVDGNDTRNYNAGSCSHTSNTVPLWWRVDFGKTAVVHSVKVTNRENIALGRNASQSSTWLEGIASKAVDGNDTRNYNAGSCSHTSNTVPLWWRVDFGKTAVVHSVKVTNRGDCCGDRLSDFNIVVGNSIEDNGGSNIACAVNQSVPLGGTKLFPCRPRLHGRYLYIQQNKAEYLTLCEVREKPNPSLSTPNPSLSTPNPSSAGRQVYSKQPFPRTTNNEMGRHNPTRFLTASASIGSWNHVPFVPLYGSANQTVRRSRNFSASETTFPPEKRRKISSTEAPKNAIHSFR